MLSLLTGCFAGATESLIVVPFELVKIRLQDKSQAHLYRGPVDVVRAIAKQNGWSGLYRGLGSTMVRHILWNGGYFATIFQLRGMLPKAQSNSERLCNSLLSGTVGGFVGTVLNTPADVVKTRIQNADRLPGVQPKYTGTLSGMFTILREEGPGALYKGFNPKVGRGNGTANLLGPTVGARWRHYAPGGRGTCRSSSQVVTDQARQWLGPPYVRT